SSPGTQPSPPQRRHRRIWSPIPSQLRRLRPRLMPRLLPRTKRKLPKRGGKTRIQELPPTYGISLSAQVVARFRPYDALTRSCGFGSRRTIDNSALQNTTPELEHQRKSLLSCKSGVGRPNE